jgi:hypothetical protein
MATDCKSSGGSISGKAKGVRVRAGPCAHDVKPSRSAMWWRAKQPRLPSPPPKPPPHPPPPTPNPHPYPHPRGLTVFGKL